MAVPRGCPRALPTKPPCTSLAHSPIATARPFGVQPRELPRRHRRRPPTMSRLGGMRERPNRMVSKTIVAQVTLGSNPSPSAIAARARFAPGPAAPPARSEAEERGDVGEGTDHVVGLQR